MNKLEYIKTVDNPTATHPAFWAAFVLIGDEQPIALAAKGNNLVWWGLGAVILLVLGGAIFALRKPSK